MAASRAQEGPPSPVERELDGRALARGDGEACGPDGLRPSVLLLALPGRTLDRKCQPATARCCPCAGELDERIVVTLDPDCGLGERSAAGGWCLHFFFCAEDARQPSARKRSTGRKRFTARKRF